MVLVVDLVRSAMQRLPRVLVLAVALAHNPSLARNLVLNLALTLNSVQVSAQILHSEQTQVYLLVQVLQACIITLPNPSVWLKRKPKI